MEELSSRVDFCISPLLPQDFIIQVGAAMVHTSLSYAHLPLIIGGKSWIVERDAAQAAALTLVLCPGQGLPQTHLCIPCSQAKDAEGVRKVKRFAKR